MDTLKPWCPSGVSTLAGEGRGGAEALSRGPRTRRRGAHAHAGRRCAPTSTPSASPASRASARDGGRARPLRARRAVRRSLLTRLTRGAASNRPRASGAGTSGAGRARHRAALTKRPPRGGGRAGDVRRGVSGDNLDFLKRPYDAPLLGANPTKHRSEDYMPSRGVPGDVRSIHNGHVAYPAQLQISRGHRGRVHPSSSALHGSRAWR